MSYVGFHMYVVLRSSSAVPQECYLGLALNCSGHGRLRSCLCECDEGWYTDLSSLVGPDTSFVLLFYDKPVALVCSTQHQPALSGAVHRAEQHTHGVVQHTTVSAPSTAGSCGERKRVHNSADVG